MGSINIYPFASGSTGNCMLIEMDDLSFIVDFGIRYRSLVNKLNYHKKNIDNISMAFITHAHGDHTIGFDVISKHVSFNCYGSRQTAKTMKDKITALEFDEPIELHPDFLVTLIRTSHDCLGSCGYLFEYHGFKIGYATDLGYVSEQMLSLFEGADVIVIECNHDITMLMNGPYPLTLKNRVASGYGHLSNDDCGIACYHWAQKGTKNFLLAHLSQENNRPDIAVKTVQNALSELDCFVKALPVEGKQMFSFSKVNNEN